MSTYTQYPKPGLAVAGPIPRATYSDTLGFLQVRTENAARNYVQGLAAVNPRDGGAYDLMVRGSAREEGNPMAVVGMLSAVHKPILEVH